MTLRRHLLLAGAVFIVAVVALAALRSGSALHPPFPRDRAVAAAARNPGVKSYLQANSYTRSQVIALDRDDWRVTFSDGPRLVLDVAVGPDGGVAATQPHPRGSHPPGSKTLWTPALLVLLGALFFFAVAAWPLRRLRNLDALVVAGGFVLSALLLDARLIGPQVFAGAAALAYLAFRLVRIGFGKAEAAVGEPLYTHVVGRARAKPAVLGAIALVLVGGIALIVTSTNASDVAFAGMAGGTLLNHGAVPYGHLPGPVVHGDTYPLLSYVLYMPFAAIGPVRDAADSLDGALWLNAMALTLGALLVARFAGRSQALAWLAFPPVLLAASSGGNDVPAAVFVIAALLAFGTPVAGAALLALAGWVKIVPAAALVPWLAARRGPPARRAAAVVAALILAGLAAIVALDGTGALADAWRAMRFQFVRGSWYSIWQQTGTRWLQLVFQAGTLAFAAIVAIELARGGASSIGLRRTAALGGALVALLQISANYWTYTYLPWLLPFILVALFPSEPRRSPPPAPPAP